MFIGQLANVSNREDMQLLFEIQDEDTGDAVDLSSASVVLRVNDENGYTKIDASTDNGKISLSSSTVMQLLIPRSDMTTLDPGNYDVGMTITNEGITRSVIVASMTVVDGVVPQ